MNNVVDNRANLGPLEKELKVGGAFHEFVKYIKNHPEEKLALCFRGNGSPQNAVIYYNNHKVWELYIGRGKKLSVRISFDHARYSEDWKKKLERLCSEEFQFHSSKFQDINNAVQKKARKNESSKITYAYTIGELVSAKAKFDKQFVKDSYKIIKQIIVDYFNPNLKIDFFKKYIERENYINKKHKSYIEKIRQQEIYNEFVNHTNGLYIYDLEFAQKGIKRKEKNSNQPDMLGIKFENNKPKSLILIEVKSTQSAMEGKTSGLKKHLNKMEEYLKEDEFIKNRKIEAKDIITLYKELGLHNAENINNEADYTKLSTGIMVILTDEAAKIFESEYRKTLEEYSLDYKIMLPDAKGRIIIKK